MTFYTLRTLRMRHTKIRSGAGARASGRQQQKSASGRSANPAAERYVLQYQFTSWPDGGGVPPCPLPLLGFVRRSSDANREAEAPIVVQRGEDGGGGGTTGGRVGTYIIVDTMLKQMKARGEINLLAYLRHIRAKKNSLVQSEEQYIFVHDMLAEAVAAGETSIHRSYLSRYINSLQSSFTTDENSIPWQLLDRQFKLATAYQPQEAEFMAALNPLNQPKNQNFDYLPIESSRVMLCTGPGTEASGYINASWLTGFSSYREFIITQHPMEQTVLDFWQLVWKQNIRTVVVLSPIQQPVSSLSE